MRKVDRAEYHEKRRHNLLATDGGPGSTPRPRTQLVVARSHAQRAKTINPFAAKLTAADEGISSQPNPASQTMLPPLPVT
jgi:hypothetical protein